jgi:hypothetical protein
MHEGKLPSNRNFGFVFSIFFLLIYFYIYINSEISLTWILIISAIFFILGAFNSKLLNPLNKIWYKFGIILGKIISPFIMGFIFYFIITPTGILMKVMKKDLLNLKFDKKEKSYWIKKSTIKSKMKNQF